MALVVARPRGFLTLGQEGRGIGTREPHPVQERPGASPADLARHSPGAAQLWSSGSYLMGCAFIVSWKLQETSWVPRPRGQSWWSWLKTATVCQAGFTHEAPGN